MKDVRKQLAIALVAAIKAAIPGRNVYTKVPKGVTYPYIFIAAMYDIEDGPKNQFFYQYDTIIEVVYENVDAKDDMWDDVNAIKGLINNDVPFSLTDNFSIMQATLIETDETEDLINSLSVDITDIRVNFEIEDNN